MYKYKLYPKYKESGVEWLGEIPEHWKTIRYKYILNIFQGYAFKSSDYIDESRVINIRMGNIKKGGRIDLTHNLKYLPERYIKQYKNYILKNNDVIIAMTDMSPSLEFLAVPATLKNLREDKIYLLNQRVGKLQFSQSVNANYVKYTLLSYELREYFKSSGLGTVQANMSNDDLYQAIVTFPCIEEQQIIANYLDKATAKIDTLIQKQEQLIELLKEKRQALISHTVTKGLNPDVKMKDSGIEWLGEIPEHWKVKKFKYLFEIKKRISGKLGYDILSITQEGIKVKDIKSGKGQLSSDYTKYQHVYKGDFAMNHMDLLTGFVDLSKYDGVTSPDYRVFSIIEKNADADYYLFLLQMGYINKIFYPLGQGSSQFGRWRLPSDAFKEFQAPFPPQEEQEQIAKYIDDRLKQFAKLTEKATKAIELLKERRTALISAVVTGKIDVREFNE